MNSIEPEPEQRGIVKRFLYGRSLGPMLGPLIACAIAAVLVYLFVQKMPAFRDVVKPVYFVIGAAMIIFIGRALRSRLEGRRKGDRRHGDRRNEQ